LLIDPVAEGLADDRVGYVDKPLLRHVQDLLFDGQALPEVRVPLAKLENVFGAETLIVRNIQVRNGLA
jgi:hypothetical protein